MGENILSVNYVLFVSLFVSFHVWSQNEPSEGWGEKSPVDKYTKDSKARFSFTPWWGINVKAHHTPTKPPQMTIPTPTNQ